MIFPKYSFGITDIFSILPEIYYMSTINLVVRFNKKLHAELTKLAKLRHQSLNGLINSTMEAEAKKVEKKMPKSLV